MVKLFSFIFSWEEFSNSERLNNTGNDKYYKYTVRHVYKENSWNSSTMMYLVHHMLIC